jgi:hypothetical protein
VSELKCPKCNKELQTDGEYVAHAFYNKNCELNIGGDELQTIAIQWQSRSLKSESELAVIKIDYVARNEYTKALKELAELKARVDGITVDNIESMILQALPLKVLGQINGEVRTSAKAIITKIKGGLNEKSS